MFAILKREVKAYFQTVTGWLFIAAVLVLYGLYFYVYNLRAGYPYISYSLSAIAFIMLITVPVLTMQQFCGGTPQQNRPVDFDRAGICGKSSIGKISRNGFCIYHRYGDHCNHTIAVNVLRNDPIRGILCSSAWILAVWLRLHCRWYVYFLIDRKPGDFRSFDICCIICRLYDGKHL